MSYVINVRYEGINDENYGDYPPGARSGQRFGWYDTIEEARHAARDSLRAAGVDHVEISKGDSHRDFAVLVEQVRRKENKIVTKKLKESLLALRAGDTEPVEEEI